MITILASVVALAYVANLFAGRATATKRQNWRGGLIVLGACFIAVMAWPGGMVLRKVLIELAMPCGMLWLLLAGLALVAWRMGQRRLSALICVAWLFFSLAGNAWVVNGLFGWLEHDYRRIVPLEEGPFDAVVVLGGATGTAPNGQSQLAPAGDRVRLGAALYLAGRTPRLICTGQRIAGVSVNLRDASEEVAQLWQQMGVPADNITQLRGRTTGEEMVAVREYLERKEWQRVGLVTSACHLRRALRLARREGLQLEPLPADFIARTNKLDGLSIIPDGAAMLRTHLGWKELLAGWLGQ